MSAKQNFLIGLLSLTTVAGGVLAWQQHEKLLAAEAANEQALAKSDADWQKRFAALEQRSRDLESALASSRRHAEEAKESEVAESRGANRRGWRGGPDGRMGDFLAMMDDPKFAKLMATEQRGMLDNRYASLFKNLKLSPEQLQKFKDLLVEKQDSMRDVMQAARAQGLDPRSDRAAFQQLVAQTNAELDATIASTLGAQGYQQYQQYEQTLPERNLVSQLDQRLSYSATPLTQEQQDQLIQVLSQSAPPTNPDRLARSGPNGPRYNVTDQSIASASTVLTPDQVAALQQLQQEQQAQRAIFQQMRNQQPGGGNTGAPTAAPVTGGTAAPGVRVTTPGTTQ